MDNLRLQKLLNQGVDVKRENVRVIQPKIDVSQLTGVLQENLAGLIAALAANGQVTVDISSLAGAIEGQSQALANAVSNIKPTTVVNQPKLKKVKFTVTRRDQLGNLVGFEAEPEYE